MMKIALTIRWLVVTVTLLVLGAVTPTAADDYDDCDQLSDRDVKIRGCSRLIDSGVLSASDLAIAHSERGTAFSDKGDLDRAIADYSKAIQIRPDYDIAYYNRGNAHRGKGDFDRAIADYSEAIQIKPDHDLAYYNRGLAYDANGDFDRAIADFDKAIEIDPDDHRVYNNRGIAYKSLGEYERAITDYDRAIEIKPDHASAFFNRGVAHWSIAWGQDDGSDFVTQIGLAYDDVVAAIEFDPEFGSAYCLRGQIDLEMTFGDYGYDDLEKGASLGGIVDLCELQ